MKNQLIYIGTAFSIMLILIALFEFLITTSDHDIKIICGKGLECSFLENGDLEIKLTPEAKETCSTMAVIEVELKVNLDAEDGAISFIKDGIPLTKYSLLNGKKGSFVIAPPTRAGPNC